MDTHQPQRSTPHVLFQSYVSYDFITPDKIVGNLLTNLGLAYTRASTEGNDLSLTHTMRQCIESFPWIRVTIVGELLGNSLPYLTPINDTIGTVHWSIPYGMKYLLPLARHQHLVGILHWKLGYLCLTYRQHSSALLGCFATSLIIIKHENYLFKSGEIIHVVCNDTLRSCCTVGYRYYGPLVVLYLADAKGINLTFGYHQLLTPTPQVGAIQSCLGEIPKGHEVLLR